MIQAVFYKSDNHFVGFEVKGHAGYAVSGKDIVCASVSSAVMLTANLITEGFGISADVSDVDDCVRLRISNSCEQSDLIIRTLMEHLDAISYEFKRTIKLKTLEV